MSGPLTYLACPYSHPSRSVRVARFEAANFAAAKLIRAGLHVYSPISHTHGIAEAGALPLDWSYWEPYDRIFLRMSSRLVVLTLDGWEESTGIDAEISIAHDLGLRIELMAPHEERPSMVVSLTRPRAVGGATP